MKPISDLSGATKTATKTVAVIAVTLSLAACGQKGPLFMPAKLPPPIVRTAPVKANVAPGTSNDAMTPAQPEAVDIPTTMPTTTPTTPVTR